MDSKREREMFSHARDEPDKEIFRPVGKPHANDRGLGRIQLDSKPARYLCSEECHLLHGELLTYAVPGASGEGRVGVGVACALLWCVRLEESVWIEPLRVGKVPGQFVCSSARKCDCACCMGWVGGLVWGGGGG